MKESLGRRITVYFLIIMVLMLIISASWNYFSTTQSILDMEKRIAEGCAGSVRSLLDHYGDALKAKKDSEEYSFLWNAIHNFCQGFRQKAIYLYTLDSRTGRRHVLMEIISSKDPDEPAGQETDDAAVKERDALSNQERDALSNQEGSALSGRDEDTLSLQELSLDEAESALLAGDVEPGKVVHRERFGGSILWVALYTKPDNRDPIFIAMEISTALEYRHIFNDFMADILLPVIALAAAFLVLNMMIRKRVTKPILMISDQMKRYAHSSGEPSEPLNIKNKDEIGEIAASFTAMTEEINAHMKDIERLTKERVETNVELDIARRIQYGLVPEKTLLMTDAFQVSAMTRPARAVGGDFYDCFRRENGEVCIVMGDVSGKGITGAIFMAVIKTIIREKLTLGLSPAQALNQTNEELMAQNPENFFVTVFAAVLDPYTGELTHANAGHTYPVLLRDEASYLQPEEGCALGLFDDADIQDESLKLSPGQGIVLYTDGLTDALNAQQVSFGMENLLEALKDVPHGPDAAMDVLGRIERSVDAYCGGVEPFDDMAVLTMFVTEAQDGEDMRQLPVSLSSFEEVKRAVFALNGDTQASRNALVALDEALTNIVRYSGADRFAFRCIRRGNTLSVVFADNGTAFDPTAHLTGEKDFEQLDSGGMGLNLIRQIASSLHYERKNDTNLFTMQFPA